MRKLKLVDDVIEEPLSGAHRKQEQMFARVKEKIKEYLEELDAIDPKTRVHNRIEKFNSMGVWQ